MTNFVSHPSTPQHARWKFSRVSTLLNLLCKITTKLTCQKLHKPSQLLPHRTHHGMADKNSQIAARCCIYYVQELCSRLLRNFICYRGTLYIESAKAWLMQILERGLAAQVWYIVKFVHMVKFVCIVCTRASLSTRLGSYTNYVHELTQFVQDLVPTRTMYTKLHSSYKTLMERNPPPRGGVPIYYVP